MTRRTSVRTEPWLSMLLAVALMTIPMAVQAQTNTTIQPIKSAPVSPGLPSSVRPAAEARLTVALQGSYGALTAGQVTVTGSGQTLAQGNVSQALAVRSSGPVDVAVVATGLVDRPTVVVRGVSLPQGGGALTVPVSIATGSIRVEATIGGAPVSGVVWLTRIDAATGQPEAQTCGSLGANTSAREISAGRYRVVLNSGSTTLSQVVEIAAGASRLVHLQG